METISLKRMVERAQELGLDRDEAISLMISNKDDVRISEEDIWFFVRTIYFNRFASQLEDMSSIWDIIKNPRMLLT